MLAWLRAAALAALVVGGCGGGSSPDAGSGDGDGSVTVDAGGGGDGGTACGQMSCDPDLQICVVRGPVGPGYSYTCEAIPVGCESDRTCACAGATYCMGAFDTCSEDVAGNTITCECPACQ